MIRDPSEIMQKDFLTFVPTGLVVSVSVCVLVRVCSECIKHAEGLAVNTHPSVWKHLSRLSAH